MARYRYRMPFGAEVLASGAVRFRLWAPAARQVQLVLPERHERHEMQALEEGWFELVTDQAGVGSTYRYCVDGRLEVPDPASRFNPEDAQGPSVVVDPEAFEWTDAAWRARPWHEAVIYELHVGTFSPEGTFAGAQRRLDHLVDLGITALELLPLADFPGKRGWGYDGVLPFAPDAAYGNPEELKTFINAAHARGLAVLLDVVYNHFGPEGNYLHAYAPQFFTDRHRTPWGQAINFDGAGSRAVRDFFIHNALYWLEEYRFDGLRFDAVHAICDDGKPDFLTELARAVRGGPGSERPVYLVLENGKNQAHYLGPPGAPATFDAQWDDDIHHCLHVILTGETDGYYEDYATAPHAMLCRCLAEGFAYQGELSSHAGQRPRGEPSAHLPPTAFVSFLQNHDQVGNRACGERLHRVAKSEAAVRAASAIVLLAPLPPLLFMGEEWAAPEPFPFFCDFSGELAQAVREGRRREFAGFAKFGATLEIPDAVDESTFRSACLSWDNLAKSPHAQCLEHYRRLLAIRQRDIVPLIPLITSSRCIRLESNGAFAVDWSIADGSVLHLTTNLTDRAVPVVGRAAGRALFATHPSIDSAFASNELAPWSVTWLLERSRAGA